MTGKENPGAAGGRQTGANAQSRKHDNTTLGDLRQESQYADLLNLPAFRELSVRRQWCVWKLEKRDGKITKVPYVADSSGERLSTVDPDDWRTLTDAIDIYANNEFYSGIGFVFTRADPYVGIDLDKCIDDKGEIEPWAKSILAKVESYAELSPSKRGIHIICRGRLPEGSRHRRGHIEIYDTGRYFTITGWHVPNTPRTINDCGVAVAALSNDLGSGTTKSTSPSAPPKLANLIAELEPYIKASAKANAQKIAVLEENSPTFSAVWRRTVTNPDWSPSEWDLSLANHFLAAGWSYPEIVEALIEHRRMHGGKEKLRADYYARTLLKARAYAGSCGASPEPASFDFASLVERTKTDSGAAFECDAIAALRRLRDRDRSAFERVRSDLKKSGVRLGGLDHAISAASGDEFGGERKTQVQALVKLVLSESELFHNTEDVGFADIRVDGRRETWPVRSRQYKLWVMKRFYDETKGAPASDAIQSALGLIESHARFSGDEREVYLRVANDGNDCIYLDLCDKECRVIKIDRNGWRIVVDPPVRFRRSRGMLSLPAPERGGIVEELRVFINLRKPRGIGSNESDDFILVVAWLIAVLRGIGPFPILAIKGEHGSAKSTVARILRNLVDPNTAAIRSLSREDRDLFIAAINGFVLSFDNVSKVPDWLSDSLCRIATGGGFATQHLQAARDRGNPGGEPMSSGAKTVRRTLFAQTDSPKIASLGAILGRGARGTRQCQGPMAHLHRSKVFRSGTVARFVIKRR